MLKFIGEFLAALSIFATAYLLLLIGYGFGLQ